MEHLEQTCVLCGFVSRGANHELLVVAAREHMQSVHPSGEPEWPLPPLEAPVPL